MQSAPLLGRDGELLRLYDLVDRAPSQGGALVLRGEGGIGKSSLLAAAGKYARTRDMRILKTAAVQSEAHLPFAGLHQLLLPTLSEVNGLPARQRDALLSAFGMAESAAPNLFLVALAATRTLLLVAAVP